MRHDKQMMEAWRRCVEFNDANPIGSFVLFRPKIGSDRGAITTTTQSAAWALPNGQTLVRIENDTTAAPLEHLERITGGVDLAAKTPKPVAEVAK
jgi:hypothetical protein